MRRGTAFGSGSTRGAVMRAGLEFRPHGHFPFSSTLISDYIHVCRIPSIYFSMADVERGYGEPLNLILTWLVQE